jgi:lysophospholipase L1-like esterase
MAWRETGEPRKPGYKKIAFSLCRGNLAPLSPESFMNHFIRFAIALCGVFAAANIASAQSVSIMPLGDSITVGVDYTTDSSGGYRSPLYSDLLAEGITPQFVGATDTSPTTLLTSTGNQYHNGYGSYQIQDLTNNLNGDAQPMVNGQPYGDSNEGGYWLTGGNGTGRSAVSPNIVLLEIGTNDFLQETDLANIDDRIQLLITTFHSLSPSSIILVAGAIPINNNDGFNAEISTYDSYIQNTLVPSLSYTRYVNLYSDFIASDGSTISAYYGDDNIHPNAVGYPVIASTWAAAIQQLEVPEPPAFTFVALGLVGLIAVGAARKRVGKAG